MTIKNSRFFNFLKIFVKSCKKLQKITKINKKFGKGVNKLQKIEKSNKKLEKY